MQKTVTGLGSQMRVLVASVRRPADMAVLAAQARPQNMMKKKACACVENAPPFFLEGQSRASIAYCCLTRLCYKGTQKRGAH